MGKVCFEQKQTTRPKTAPHSRASRSPSRPISCQWLEKNQKLEGFDFGLRCGCLCAFFLATQFVGLEPERRGRGLNELKQSKNFNFRCEKIHASQTKQPPVRLFLYSSTASARLCVCVCASTNTRRGGREGGATVTQTVLP